MRRDKGKRFDGGLFDTSQCVEIIIEKIDNKVRDSFPKKKNFC